MKYFTLFLILLISIAHAEMVDTFQFHNQADRTRAVALAKSLRCPQCQNQNLVESNSPIAYDLRLEVYQMVNDGKTDQQIIDVMTSRFGNFVLYKPPLQWTTALLWGAPIVLLILGMGLMFHYVGKRSQIQTKNTALSDKQQQALQQLLEKKQ